MQIGEHDEDQQGIGDGDHKGRFVNGIGVVNGNLQPDPDPLR
jgi:hypothetical protein